MEEVKEVSEGLVDEEMDEDLVEMDVDELFDTALS